MSPGPLLLICLEDKHKYGRTFRYVPATRDLGSVNHPSSPRIVLQFKV